MHCNGDDFKAFDADRGGTITKWEMMAMFRQALFIRKHELSDFEVELTSKRDVLTQVKHERDALRGE